MRDPRAAMPPTRGAAILLLVVAVLSFGCATMSAPESIESLLQQAKELLDAKKYDEALTKITEVIRRDPAQWKAYLYGAQAYIGKLDWSAALANARKAFELAPSDATVLTILGESLLGSGADALKRGAFNDAAVQFVEYIKLRPTDAQGYLSAAGAYLRGRQWTDAARVLTDGVARIPDGAVRREFMSTLRMGGAQAATSGDYQGAISLSREYVRLAPQDVTAHLELGKAYWNAGQRPDALAAFRRVLELAPQNEEARQFILGR